MNKRIFSMLLIGATLILTPVTSFSMEQCPKQKGGMQKHEGGKMWSALNLNQEQKDKLKDLHQEMQQARQEHMDNLKRFRDKTKEELLKANPSQNVLNGLAVDFGKTEQNFAEKRAAHMLKVKALLTPEQFKKLMDKDMMMHRKGGQKCDKMPGCEKGKTGGKMQCPRSGEGSVQ